jgi:TM2 domain-containing membrane protein YozV/ribosomal protein L40E
MSAWYVIEDRKKVGPLSFQQLRERVFGHRLRPEDMVLQEGMQGWAPASTVPDLFAPVPTAAVVPPAPAETRFCRECGATIRPNAEICPKCGVRQFSAAPAAAESNRIGMALLALLLPFGIHKFALGYQKAGVIQVLLCFAGLVGVVISLIEGVVYLTKSDEEFRRTYQEGRKEWF